MGRTCYMRQWFIPVHFFFASCDACDIISTHRELKASWTHHLIKWLGHVCVLCVCAVWVCVCVCVCVRVRVHVHMHLLSTINCTQRMRPLDIVFPFEWNVHGLSMCISLDRVTSYGSDVMIYLTRYFSTTPDYQSLFCSCYLCLWERQRQT